MTSPDTHRDWLIEEAGRGRWEATHPDFDPCLGFATDGPEYNRYVTAPTRAAVIEAIDRFIEGN